MQEFSVASTLRPHATSPIVLSRGPGISVGLLWAKSMLGWAQDMSDWQRGMTM